MADSIGLLAAAILAFVVVILLTPWAWERKNYCDVLIEELEEAGSQVDGPEKDDAMAELTFQALICAYVKHRGWKGVAEAIFAQAGYTPEEIVDSNK